MLGWHVSVYRKTADQLAPATFDSDLGVRLAVWQGRLGCLDWIDNLTKTSDAIDLGGNGYPLRYTSRASALTPTLLSGPPDARDPWIFGVDDVIDFSVWVGHTLIEEDLISECHPDEWLVIEAWDES